MRPKGPKMLHRRERPRQPPVLERAVAQYWRDHGASLPALECDDGTKLRVLYPGRSSASAGPDFRDAVLQRPNGEVIRGDVEIHVRKGGWEAHGHGSDRHYNGVILHVVLHPDSGGNASITLASGIRVPTAALFPRTLSRDSAVAWLKDDTGINSTNPDNRRSSTVTRPLLLAALPNIRIERLLDRAGDARFLRKSRQFRHSLSPAIPKSHTSSDPAEILYQGLMVGLGYGGNGEAFLQLAQGLPLTAIGRSVTGVPNEERRSAIATTLLQASGLFNPEAGMGETYPTLPVVDPSAWHLFRVRPNNHPSRRIMGMAELLHRAWDTGLVGWASALVSTHEVASVKSALTVAEPKVEAEKLIGSSRAADLAVNVVLPFVHAWGIITKMTALPDSALSLYRTWPPLQENAITRETLRVISSLPRAQPWTRNSLTEEDVGETNEPKSKKTARRQQGLIYHGDALAPHSLTEEDVGETNEPKSKKTARRQQELISQGEALDPKLPDGQTKQPQQFKKTARRQQGLIYLYKKHFQSV